MMENEYQKRIIDLFDEAGYRLKSLTEEQVVREKDLLGKNYYRPTGDILIRITPKGNHRNTEVTE